MKKITKQISLLLAVLMIGMLFVGCSSKDKKPEESSQETTVSTAGNTDETRKPLAIEKFGDGEGNPKDFMIAVRANRYKYLYATSKDSETVAKAAYERNLMIEEQFNVLFDIKQIQNGASNWNTLLMGSTGEYDLACFDYLFRVEEMGVLLNILEMPEIDPMESHWYHGWNQVGTINNKMYSIAGDACNEMAENMSVIFYNKNVASEHGFNMYDIVDEGEWTLEKMRTLSKDTAFKDDGDPTRNTFGAMFDLHSIRMANACFGIVITQPTENGYYEVVDNAVINERNFEVIKRFQDFVRNSGDVQYDYNTCRDRETDTFTSGKSLFFATALLIGEKIAQKGMSWEFGVLPYPKFESEDSYRSTVYGCSIFGVPISVSDQHCSAVILNALNYYGKDSNVNAFYNKVVLGHVTDKADDQRMLEMVRTNIAVDFAFIHDENVMTLFQRYGWAVTHGDDPASLFAEHKITAENGLKKVLQAYQ